LAKLDSTLPALFVVHFRDRRSSSQHQFGVVLAPARRCHAETGFTRDMLHFAIVRRMVAGCAPTARRGRSGRASNFSLGPNAVTLPLVADGEGKLGLVRAVGFSTTDAEDFRLGGLPWALTTKTIRMS
jgi:hypothetical protein